MNIKIDSKYNEIKKLRLSIEKRLKKVKSTEDSIRNEIKLLKGKGYVNDGSSSKELVKELKGKLRDVLSHKVKFQRVFDSMSKIVGIKESNVIENIELNSEYDFKINENLKIINSISKISHETKNEMPDSVKDNIININNQNHWIKQNLIRIVELTSQIDKEHKEAKLQPVSQIASSQTLSEQMAAFQLEREGSSVIENLVEIPIKSHGMGKCGCGGLGRTAFC